MFHNLDHHPGVVMTLDEVTTTLDRFGIALPADLKQVLAQEAEVAEFRAEALLRKPERPRMEAMMALNIMKVARVRVKRKLVITNAHRNLLCATAESKRILDFGFWILDCRNGQIQIQRS